MASHRLATGKIHPSRLHNFPDAPKKSRRPRPTVKADDASDVTIGALRNSIRNLERLLQHNENLPANVRAEKERALESYKIDLEEADETRRSKKIIKKYHGVRFFERQKATRAIKKCKTELSNADSTNPEYENLLKNLHEAEVDLNYTQYCPLLEKYQSLWPNAKASWGNSVSEKKQDMWYLVEKAMAEGTLDELRNRKRVRKLPKDMAEETMGKEGIGSHRKQSRTSEGKGKNSDDEGNSSDGGFFEE